MKLFNRFINKKKQNVQNKTEIARELNRHQDWRNILLATYRRHVQPNLFADQTIVDRTENQLAVH